uniref:Major facilitator superfamily (MFS) profile domain-containing protein n=1 Tax=Bionectria ochroleuca TaxID=29856 RepID=A0A8H7N4Z6_BIOOC
MSGTETTNSKISCDLGVQATDSPPLHLPQSVDPSGGVGHTGDDDIESANSGAYPEGGLKAWTVVAGSWFGTFASLGILNSIGTFQAYIQEHQLQSYSPGTVGWVFSLYAFLSFFCGVYFGPIFDKYGPRGLTISGTAMMVGGLLAMSFCTGKDSLQLLKRHRCLSEVPELWQFLLAFGVACGFGTSLLFCPSIAAVGHFFKARRSLATSISSTAGGLGGVIFPLMLSSLFDSIGYAWATRAVALICLCCGSIAVFTIESRLAPAKNARAHPEFRIFRRTDFVLITAGIFLFEFSLFIPLGFISSYALHHGFGLDFSYNLVPILNAASIAGRILPGYYADLVGPLNMNVFALILSVVACFGVWLPAGHTAAGIIAFAVLFGFATGTLIALAPVCVGQVCETQDYGRYYATSFSVVSFACLISIPIGGSIVNANGGDYAGLIILTGVIYAVSGFVLIGAKAYVFGLKNWAAVY